MALVWNAGRMPKKRSANLTGDKFKTRKFSDYTGMKNETVILSPIKGLNGEIDFTDADTYVNLDADELDVYVGLESSKLNEEIENVFAEEGTFKTHVDEEYKRLGDAFGKYYGQWAAGEALQNAGFYAKPIFPNGPNIMNVGVMAAGIAGGPWAGFAAQMLVTGIQVADGSMNWQQAGVQMGVGFAKSATGMLSPLVDMASSGITYDADGGIGWDKKQFKQGVKSAAIRAGVQFVTGSSVATNVVMSGVNVGGSWTDIGFDNKHWGEHIMTGVASGISQGVGAATGNAMVGSMVQQGLLTAAYKMSGGHGFKTDYSSYNWNAMAPGAETFGSQLGNMFSSYMKERYARTENGNSVPYESGRSDPLGFVDDMLGAAYYGMQKVNEYANDISAGIRGLTGLDHVRGLGLDLDQAFNKVGQSAAYRAMDAGSTVWGGIKDSAGMISEGLADLFDNPELVAQNENYDSIQRIRVLAVQSSYGINSENDTMEIQDNNHEKEIADLEAQAKKLEKKNPDEARWLRAKAEMMRDGIEVSEGSVDTTNALEYGSMSYYEIKDFMKAADPMERRMHLENLQKIKEFKKEFNQEPSRFMLYYDCDPEKLTDPEKYRQELDGTGPVSDIISSKIFSELINNSDSYPFTGTDKGFEKQFNDLKENLTNVWTKDNTMQKYEDTVHNAADGYCWMETLYFLSVANEKYNGSFEDFSLEGYQNGTFGGYNKDGKLTYDWVTDPWQFAKQANAGDFSDKYADSEGENAQYVILRIDRSEKGDKPGGTHFAFAGRTESGWISFDHDDKRRPVYDNKGNIRKDENGNPVEQYKYRSKKVDWKRVRNIYFIKP